MDIQTNVINQLTRNVDVTDDGILVTTEKVSGATYAFYLESDRGREKQHIYSDTPSHLFKIKPLSESYTAVFFYKVNNVKTIVEVVFFITSEGRAEILNKSVIGSGKGYRIDYYDIGSDITFIVFNGTGSNLSERPFGLNFLLSQGYNVIACLQQNNQYQTLSLEAFENHVKPLVSDKETFLYGSSLGGYCAIYYAGAIDGTVIASAPRNSAHPEVVKGLYGSAKFKDSKFTHKNIAQNKRTSKEVYIFIDPHLKSDTLYLRSLISPAYPQAKVLPFEHAGHEVLMHVNATGQLKKIINRIVRSTEIPDINFTVESSFTDIGRSRFYLENNCVDVAKFYAQKLQNTTIEHKWLATKYQMLLQDLRSIDDRSLRNKQ